MFNNESGKLIANIKSRRNKNKNELIFISEDIEGYDFLKLMRDDYFIPVPDITERQITYICGPSGSGKSTYAKEYIKSYLTIYPNNKFFAFSRTNIADDPAFSDIRNKVLQVNIDQDLVDYPIDITSDLDGDCIILFDDVNTINNDKIKKEIDKLISDILEVGRKLRIYCVITSHLIIPNDKKIARTILNECQSLTVFPKSGSVQQIRYALKTYFGYSNKQIDNILNTSSRWITISKTYPQYILTEKELFVP